MPFIHLPIQSGSNKILQLMNRKHTVEQYINIYKKIKKINKEIEFSSDFIISYPGETEKDFEDTLNLLKRINFINSYSFIFSPRPGTKAAKLEQIDEKISKERLKEIQKHLFSHQRKKNKYFEGKIIDVLVENKIKGQPNLFGRNKYMNSVIINADEENLGKIVNVKIEKSNQNSLFGKIENNKSALPNYAFSDSDNEDTNNVGVGAYAGYYNVTGQSNTWVGADCGTGASGQSNSNNTGIGHKALYAITTGGENVAVGSNAGVSITSGNYNIAIGFNAGSSIVTESSTTYIGYEVGRYIDDGANNVAVGYRSMKGASTGNVTIYCAPTIFADAHSSPVRIPARGP